MVDEARKGVEKGGHHTANNLGPSADPAPAWSYMNPKSHERCLGSVNKLLKCSKAYAHDGYTKTCQRLQDVPEPTHEGPRRLNMCPGGMEKDREG